MSDQLHDVVITVDAHVGETDDLRRRLPEAMRDKLPEFTIDKDGNLDIKVKGESTFKSTQRIPNKEDLMREFRSDPSQGTDIKRRLKDMAIEGVDAQVIFPNIGLGISRGVGAADPNRPRVAPGGTAPTIRPYTHPPTMHAPYE